MHAAVFALPSSPTLSMRDEPTVVRLLAEDDRSAANSSGSGAGSTKMQQPAAARRLSAKASKSSYQPVVEALRAEPSHPQVPAAVHHEHLEPAFTDASARKISLPAVVGPTVATLSGQPTGGAGIISGVGAGGATGSGFGDGTGSGNGSGTGHGKGSVEAPPLSQAHPAHTVKPEYPDEARRDGSEGTVLLRVLVNRQGRPHKIEINRSSGFEALDQAAQKAVEKWRFHPASAGDANFESWVRIPIVFRLEDLRR
jgi:protein TonB